MRRYEPLCRSEVQKCSGFEDRFSMREAHMWWEMHSENSLEFCMENKQILISFSISIEGNSKVEKTTNRKLPNPTPKISEAIMQKAEENFQMLYL